MVLQLLEHQLHLQLLLYLLDLEHLEILKRPELPLDLEDLELLVHQQHLEHQSNRLRLLNLGDLVLQ